ncbi:MAG: hypothetical protein ABIN35_08545 [candidate division WOR-3 bacterium]
MNWLMNKDIFDSTRKGYCRSPNIQDEAAVKVYDYLDNLYLFEKNEYCFYV